MIALSQLANVCGVNEKLLWSAVEKYLPHDFDSLLPEQASQELQFTPANVLERIALACAFYLTGWEHLKFVRGQTARELISQAELILLDGGGESLGGGPLS